MQNVNCVIGLEEDGDDWGELLWRYISYGVTQAVRLPSFDMLTYLCNPEKVVCKAKASDKQETAADKLDTMKLFKAGKYKELIKLLLIDDKASREFTNNLSELGVQIHKYPAFMSAEEKLAEIQRIIKESETKEKQTAESQTAAVPAAEAKKDEKHAIDPNDLELD